jgi:hypothetical protein
MNTRQPHNPMSWRNELLRATMIWDPMDYPYHRSLRARITCISSTWFSHGYGLYITCYFMPIISCSLCMLCLFPCLCHAIVTLACTYMWFTIMLLLCVFAWLVEILVAIAMISLCPMLLTLVVLGESWYPIAIYIGLLANTMNTSCSYLVFMLVICHVHYICPLFAHLTWLLWFPLVCCIFALLACMTCLPWSLAWLHHPWSILARFIGLIAYMFMPLTWFVLIFVSCLH